MAQNPTRKPTQLHTKTFPTLAKISPRRVQRSTKRKLGGETMSKNQENWDSEMPEQKGFNLTEGKHEIKITGNNLREDRAPRILESNITTETSARFGEIACIELVNTRFADEKTGLAKKALQITCIPTGTEKEVNFNTGARNVWDYLRQNKPAIGKTFTFTITGEGKNRRFKDMELT